MKKILGFVLVLFFVFSLLPATHAGPTYEKLKASNTVVVTVYILKEECRKEFEKELSEGIDLMKNKTSDDPVSPEEYGKIDSRYCLGYDCSQVDESEDFYFSVTRADKIFSNISFRETMNKNGELFCKKIDKLLSKIETGDELWRITKLMSNDLISKGISKDNRQAPQ